MDKKKQFEEIFDSLTLSQKNIVNDYLVERDKRIIASAEQRGREEVIGKVKNRLGRYRCGKHWLLFRLLSELKTKKERR